MTDAKLLPYPECREPKCEVCGSEELTMLIDFDEKNAKYRCDKCGHEQWATREKCPERSFDYDLSK
jgi:predicted RNA-binding Zn-ribbon protein involved in translation (DUF1610 family)